MKGNRKILFGASAVVLALGAPLAFSPAKGVIVNDACAQNGTCCHSSDTCIVNGNPVGAGYWQSGSGSCNPTQQ
jgi:hypothetical protein